MRLTRRDFVQSALAAAAAAPHLLAAPQPPTPPQQQPSREALWYTGEAARWFEALPLGNGRLGAMVFGGVATERIALSESTVWSGAREQDVVNPQALPQLAHIRELLFAEQFAQAHELCQKSLLAHPHNFGTNLPLPELLLAFTGPAAAPGAQGYQRLLDLRTALAHTQFTLGGTHFTRECFVSHPHQVLVLHLAASEPGALSFALRFGPAVMPVGTHAGAAGTLTLRGHAWEAQHSSGEHGVRFAIQAHALPQGGTVAAGESTLTIQNASACTLLVAIATDYAGGDPDTLCAEQLAAAAAQSYPALREQHIADHSAPFSRVSLTLGAPGQSQSTQPTDLRRAAFAQGAHDPELLALFFQYGRYLTIAGARADSPLPLALQGIWNDGLASSMGWTDDFHLDINTEQNYWAAEVANLGECQQPLFRWIDSLRASGRTTARSMYGAPGWVVHTVSNPWGYTAPGWGTGWGVFVTAGIWISLQLWEHFQFSADTNFLRTTAYPPLRELSLFYLAYLVSEPKHGWLVTGPSSSPENWFLAADGTHVGESMGNTCDRALVHALFSLCIEAAQTLGVDADLCAQWTAARAKLPPFQIGKHGQLQEWLTDWEDAEPNHRHTSHLVSLYPLQQISPACTPALAQAARVTLQRRMASARWEQSEWGWANLVAYSARLLDGDAAHRYLAGLVAHATESNLLTYSVAGVAGAGQNIFAIDGNTGGTAAIAELLLQSRPGHLALLPALPTAWPQGEVHGLCARGGLQVSMRWQHGKLTWCELRSARGAHTAVHAHGRSTHVQVHAGVPLTMGPHHFGAEQDKPGEAGCA